MVGACVLEDVTQQPPRRESDTTASPCIAMSPSAVDFFTTKYLLLILYLHRYHESASVSTTTASAGLTADYGCCTVSAETTGALQQPLAAVSHDEAVVVEP